MAQWLELLPHGKKVPCSVLGPGFSVWSLYVLPVAA